MAELISMVAQAVVIIFIIMAASYSYKIAKWSCARSVQWLTAGFVYILAWRVAYSALVLTGFAPSLWVDRNQSYFIIPAYIMWAWGMRLLYKTLINLGRKNA